MVGVSWMEGEFQRPHKNLDAWKVAMDLCRGVYLLTEGLPEHEKYGLVSQLRRAEVFIPSNIAEGAARNSKAEFSQFLGIAQGSLAELDTQFILCAAYLDLLSHEQVRPILEKNERLSRMLTALKRSLRTRP